MAQYSAKSCVGVRFWRQEPKTSPSHTHTAVCHFCACLFAFSRPFHPADFPPPLLLK